MNYIQRLKLAQGKAMECALALENRLNIHVYSRVSYEYTVNGKYVFTFLIMADQPHLINYETNAVSLKTDDFMENMGQFVESELLEAFGYVKRVEPVVTLDDLLGFVGKRGE